MPVTTRLQSNLQANQALANQVSPRSSISNMFSAFDQSNELADLADITVLLEPLIDLISFEINELALDFTLDLAKHPASKILNLSATYLFASVNEFCCAVATNGA